jgi:cell division protease FtsH
MGALGYTLQLPTEDRFILTKDELIGQIDVLLGGRAAEEIEFGAISTGAANDLTRATDIARRMITDYGMSERFRHVALTRRGSVLLGSPEPYMAREYSEDTQKYVDDEIARIVAERYDYVLKRLRGERGLLDTIAGRLLELETLDQAEFNRLLGDGAATEAESERAEERKPEVAG